MLIKTKDKFSELGYLILRNIRKLDRKEITRVSKIWAKFESDTIITAGEKNFLNSIYKRVK